MSEIKKDEVLETVKETKTKKTTATKKVEKKEEKVEDNSVLKELQESNKALKEKNNELENKINTLLEKFSNINLQPTQPIIIQPPQEKKYTIVNLTSNYNFLLLNAGNWVGTFRGYCDTREVNEEIFLEIVRKYGSYFVSGDITTDSDGIKILKERGIRVATKWMTNSELRNIGNLDIKEITELLKQLIPAQKELFVEEFLNGVSRGDDKYNDINKLMAISQNYKGYKTQSLLKVINNIVAPQ